MGLLSGGGSWAAVLRLGWLYVGGGYPRGEGDDVDGRDGCDIDDCDTLRGGRVFVRKLEDEPRDEGGGSGSYWFCGGCCRRDL